MPRIRDPRRAPDCTIEVDGRPVAARAGESVAAALVAAGRLVVARSAKYHRPRGPFCLAGSCHACTARIDGVPNQRTCRVPCRPGLVVETQNGFPSAAHDLLGAIDVAYPHGLDHHHLMTWNAAANRAAVAIARRVAGTGRLADRARAPDGAPAPAEEPFDALVVGAGPAGLGAAEALAARAARVLLVEADPVPGGRLRCALASAPPASWPAGVLRRVSAAGGEVALATTACGSWDLGGTRLVLLRVDGEPARLRLVRPGVLVVATGSWALPPAVPCGDLPGVFAGRGVARMLAEDGVLPGERCVVAGDDAEEAAAVAQALRAAGARSETAAQVAAVSGHRRISGVSTPGGRRLRCDALVWCGPRAAASELARQAGAAVALDARAGWRVRADAAGRTGVPDLLVAGEVAGAMSAADAVAAGRRAGEAALGH